MDFELKGGAEMKAAMERILRAIPREVSQALYEEAQIERTESMRRTPVLTGALRASHEVSKPVMKSDGWEVTISVGGPSADYAIQVHEDLEAFHKTGQSKFLESTLLESAPFMAARVAKRIDLKKAVA